MRGEIKVSSVYETLLRQEEQARN